MRPSIPRLPNRDIPPHRRQLYYAGMAVAGVGFLLFLSNFCIMPLNMGRFGPVDGPSMAFGFAARGVGGMVLMIAGGAMMTVGARGLAGSGMVLDPQQARRDLEPYARMIGGLAGDAREEMDATRPPPTGKVRCESCGAINEGTKCRYCGNAL
jgi:hypothetical protein